MSGHRKNRYEDYLASDNNLCLPVLQQEQLEAILLRVQQIAEAMEGEGPRPAVALDLEHLQVADYAAFPLVTLRQKEAIHRLHAAEPVRTDEMAYLALRSLFCFQWEKPQSESEVRRAAAYEKALEMVLTEVSAHVAQELARPEGLLPYWGRLGFLRVMVAIPDEQIEAHGLDRFACVLLKEPVFNAHSYRYEDCGLVGLNFALEPILKGLNRMLLHYFDTQEIAGPLRLQRAWASLVPTVAFFWSRAAVAANRLSPLHVLFDPAVAQYAHALTASQVDFIIRHELGHLVLDHGRRLRALPAGAAVQQALRHEFEFAADAFAQGSLRSALYSQLRSDLQWGPVPADPAQAGAKALETLHDHQRDVAGVRLLFSYMGVIDEAGCLLKQRLGNAIHFREQVDTHPPPRERLLRLDAFHIGEHSPTSQLLRYADQFFADVLAYAGNLDDAALAAPLQGLY